MYTIKYDLKKNRLFVTLVGTMQKEEVPQYNADMKKNVGMLKSGFTVLLDLTEAQIFTQEAISLESLVETKEIAVAAGMSKSAMVVASPTLKMQVVRNFKNIGVKDEPFGTYEEAEAYLDK
jgi:hypothetical protein